MASRPRLRHGLAAPVLAAALALAASGCGSDEETTAPPVRPTPATVPGHTDTAPTETTTEQTNTSSGGGVSPTEQTTTSETTNDNSGGGGVSPGYDPAQPDSSTNDVPAEPGSPQGSFEEYCNENPGACGD